MKATVLLIGCLGITGTVAIPVHAQFAFATNNGSITIAKYTGSGGAVVVPDSVDGYAVTSIGPLAFHGAVGVTSLTLPDTVATIGTSAFAGCTALRTAHFKGNAPTADATTFSGTINMKVYRLPGTLDWSSTFGGSPTELWALPNPVILTCTGFGIQDQQFGFIVSWATNLSVAVDACSDLANIAWEPLGTNALVDGWFCFGDPGWANHSDRFYRTRKP